jgi:hypothetical protein
MICGGLVRAALQLHGLGQDAEQVLHVMPHLMRDDIGLRKFARLFAAAAKPRLQSWKNALKRAGRRDSRMGPWRTEQSRMLNVRPPKKSRSLGARYGRSPNCIFAGHFDFYFQMGLRRSELGKWWWIGSPFEADMSNLVAQAHVPARDRVPDCAH